MEASQCIQLTPVRMQMQDALKTALLAAASELMLYWRRAVPTMDDSPNPMTDADLKVSVLLFDVLDQHLSRIAREHKCHLVYLAEDFHNRNGYRRWLVRDALRHGVYSRLAKKPDDFFAAGSDTFQVIVDPIDGTDNFRRGIPHFCMGAAILTENQPRLACVYEPLNHALYSAYLAGPPDNLAQSAAATMWFTDTGQEIDLITSVRERYSKASLLRKKLPREVREKMLKDVAIAVHLTRNNAPKREDFLPYLGQLASVYPAVHMRYCGILALLGVALGQFGAFINNYTSAWDVLPGEVILRAVGGKVTDFDNQPVNYKANRRVSIVAALDADVHAAIRAILNTPLSPDNHTIDRRKSMIKENSDGYSR